MNWKKIFTAKVIIAMVVLLVSAASLETVKGLFEWVLFKKPVLLAQPLYRMADTLGPPVEAGGPYYEKWRDDPPLNQEMQDALGTPYYITRIYRDTRVPENKPGSLLRIHVAYYTGTTDTVPHVPERCVVAGGAVPQAAENTQVTLTGEHLLPKDDGLTAMTALRGPVRLPTADVPLRVIKFGDPAGHTRPFAVTYFFVANNTFVSSAEGVRLQAFNMTDRYAYYCKVEVMPLGVGEMDQAAKTVGQFLSYIMPEVMRCLPDWQKVRSGEYPVRN
jgi:hypothetical protein